MKRNMVALAVAGAFAVPGIAMAQSTVQIYGNVRILLENTNPDTAGPSNLNGSRWRVNNPGGSSLGFRGTEALGGGTTAWFQIESNISGTDGTAAGALGSRNTGVGLRGGFGNILAGNWDSPYKQQLVAMQSWGATTPYGSVGIIGHGDVTGPAPTLATIAATTSTTVSGPGPAFATIAGVVRGATVTPTAAGTAQLASVAFYGFERRLNNSVQYQSPMFGGFQAKVAYQANEAKNATTANQDPSLWAASLVYANGPLYVGLAYERHNEWLAVDRTDDAINFSARYRAGAFDIGFSYERLDYEPNATQNLERSAWQLFGQYRTGPHRLGLGYYKANDSKGSYSVVNGAVAPVGAIAPAGTDNGAKQWTLHYGYSLSKRTELTAAYSKLSNDTAGVYDLNGGGNGGTLGRGNAALLGKSPSVFAVGLWHSF